MLPPLPPDWDAQLSAPARAVLYHQIVESAHEGIWVLDSRSRSIFVNDRMAAILGYEGQEIVGRALTEFTADPVPLLHDRQEGAAVARQHEIRMLGAGGRVVWTLINASALLNDTGEVVGTLLMVVDVSKRKGAEEALRQSEQRLKTIIDVEPACVKLVSVEGLLLEMNRAGLRMIEAEDISQVMGQPIVQLVHPADRERFLTAHRAATRGRAATIECRVVGLRGTERWLEMHAVPFDSQAVESGRASVVLTVTYDLTERKMLEERLHQAQKLEAVGRLAGGVAHDFNNLLTAILGFCDLANAHLDEDHPAQSDLTGIRSAGERAVALTQQLLAFSRKQILNPRVIDLNATVEGLLRMLPRIIGEHIATSSALAPDLLRTKADPTQLEQVLVNLAVNARDAMPHGGSLTIRTANVRLDESPVPNAHDFEPGDYVSLTVTDIGTGMNQETAARIFEPFFTTKDIGHGTGLGLSTVYGIVKQSRGFITVATALGTGTTFTIYLPATSAPAEEAPVQRLVTPRGGRETVLLVEDADAVRELVRRVLAASGYRVLAARDATEALAIAEREAGLIELMVTDVVMPLMLGPQLAEHIVRAWPATRVLYISGYSEEAPGALTGHPGVPTLLKKPFTPNQLIEAVRDALDRPAT